VSLKILQTQGVASVQDLGRAGYQRYGVSPSGAMDWYAHRAANLLVGNPAEAAGVEVGLADQTCALSEPAWPNTAWPSRRWRLLRARALKVRFSSRIQHRNTQERRHFYEVLPEGAVFQPAQPPGFC